MTSFAIAPGAKLQVSGDANDLLLPANAAGLAIATGVTLTGTDNIVSVAQATRLAEMTGFAMDPSATLVVVDHANILLSSENVAGAGIATSVRLAGSNDVSATQAASLAALSDFALGAGATMVVSGSTADLLASANTAGVILASRVLLTGTANIVNAQQATDLSALTGFALAADATLVVIDGAANLLDSHNATGITRASAVMLTGTSNTVTVAGANTLIGLAGFTVAADAALVVADSAADLLASGSKAAEDLATTVSLSGSSNTVTAEQAAALAVLHGFGLGSGATLVVADTASNLLAGSNAAGVALATGVLLTGNNTVDATQAIALVGLTGFSMDAGATWVISDSVAGIQNNLDSLALYPTELAQATIQLTGAAHRCSRSARSKWLRCERHRPDPRDLHTVDRRHRRGPRRTDAGPHSASAINFVVSGTAGADVVVLPSSVTASINLGGDTASASDGFSAGKPQFHWHTRFDHPWASAHPASPTRWSPPAASRRSQTSCTAWII